ncbi:protein SODIUM POTASSIUM ROOT DEFECTIVE 2 [Daucus carota subsp. sativus]|uniref:HMA domain-containing protein n=1 Tax=Daucus carota subsp. sativus TaxID=79200 RepID=A0A165A7P4_DAUCS|nr:PREDICTED: uncharacterized protein LOC108218133 [Daucus carota subsp. sativus]
MKSIDLLCASPASTAICSSTDQRTMVRDHGTRSMDRRSDHYISSSTDQRTMVRDHGTRSMARRSDHYISDHHRRKSKTNIPAIPCSSQLPINPAFYQNNRKSASESGRGLRRASSAKIVNDLATTPHGSSRHLLSDKTLSDVLSQTDSLSAPVSSEPALPRSLSSKEPVIPRSLSSNDSALVSRDQALRPFGQLISSSDSLVLKPVNKQLGASQSARIIESSAQKSSSARSQSHYQVVELMVSIHCKGCEGKVRKHISRIEGVTSFSIDRATKKVTVIGEVTPLGVLSSISKVKSAQFWPYPTSSS